MTRKVLKSFLEQIEVIDFDLSKLFINNNVALNHKDFIVSTDWDYLIVLDNDFRYYSSFCYLNNIKLYQMSKKQIEKIKFKMSFCYLIGLKKNSLESIEFSTLLSNKNLSILKI